MVRSTAVLILILLSVSCVGRSYTSPSDRGDRCAGVTVENQTIETLAVRHATTNIRLGSVRPSTTAHLRVCRELTARFRIHAVGGAFDLLLQQSGNRMLPGDGVLVVVMESPNLSYVIDNWDSNEAP